MYPLGIKYWAEIDQSKVPHFRVYTCLGQYFFGSDYLFLSRDGQSLICKNIADLDTETFKPFLLDMPSILKKREEIQ